MSVGCLVDIFWKNKSLSTKGLFPGSIWLLFMPQLFGLHPLLPFSNFREKALCII
jgi:hypothetical protein